MKEYNLIEAISAMQLSVDLTDYQRDVCNALGEKGVSVDRKTIDKILEKYGLDYKNIKGELLDIVIFYAMFVVRDGIISQEERSKIEYLKRLFKIEEGDFFNIKINEIKDIIQHQLYKLYIDKTIDKEEALFKVNLQDLFDLSYDEMATFVNPIADEAIEKGAEIIDLETVFPNFNPNYK